MTVLSIRRERLLLSNVELRISLQKSRQSVIIDDSIFKSNQIVDDLHNHRMSDTHVCLIQLLNISLYRLFLLFDESSIDC